MSPDVNNVKCLHRKYIFYSTPSIQYYFPKKCYYVWVRVWTNCNLWKSNCLHILSQFLSFHLWTAITLISNYRDMPSCLCGVCSCLHTAVTFACISMRVAYWGVSESLVFADQWLSVDGWLSALQRPPSPSTLPTLSGCQERRSHTQISSHSLCFPFS